MNNEEFFPPTEAELEEMIKILKARLEDEKYQDDWKQLFEELEFRQNQIKKLIIKNNAL
jgi:hypothetical protein